MDLFDVVRSCFRRWYVVLPLLLITGWFAHHVYESVKPVYYSSTVIGIAPPNSRVDLPAAGALVPHNGLLDVGGPTLIANMAVFGMNDPTVAAQVVAAGGKSYWARMFPSPAMEAPLPLILIETTQQDPVSAAKTIEAAVAQAGPVLHSVQQQAGVAEDLMVKPIVVSPQTPPSPGTPSRLRSTIAIFIAGSGLAILFAVVFDVLVMRRRASKNKQGNKDNSKPSSTAETDQKTIIDRDDFYSAADEVSVDSR